jgi:transposase
MVKKRVGGAHRYKAVQKAAAGGSLDRHKAAKQQQESGPKPPSHLQRKITKSVKFYERVLSQRAPKAPQVSSIPALGLTQLRMALLLHHSSRQEMIQQVLASMEVKRPRSTCHA